VLSGGVRGGCVGVGDASIVFGFRAGWTEVLWRVVWKLEGGGGVSHGGEVAESSCWAECVGRPSTFVFVCFSAICGFVVIAVGQNIRNRGTNLIAGRIDQSSSISFGEYSTPR